MSNQLSSLDHDGLEAYFTNVFDLRNIFEDLVVGESLSKRMIVIHGVGGVGKSSVLRMFRLACKKVDVPVALASADIAKSELDILLTWAEHLKASSINLPKFTKTVNVYRKIQDKVAEHTQKGGGKIAETLGKTAVDMVGAAIPIPGLGPIIALLGNLGTEALVNRLSGFLSKQEIELLLDPANILSDNFLNDLQENAKKQRIVLMLDTFEQMPSLDSWSCSLTQRMDSNVLIVIAGRVIPNWNRQWPGWLAHAYIKELKPMSVEVMRELISRYYNTIHDGEPDPIQVDAIIRFARGLPIVVTSAVKLWVQYGVEDFKTIKPQVVADLVDRLVEGVSKEMIPFIEASAIVRWFNKDILRLLSHIENVNLIYDELRRFPFVRPRSEGFAIHDAVREIIDENLRVHDQERHQKLHEQAATYYREKAEISTGAEAERQTLEQLYHLTRANEQTGIQLFQKMAGKLEPYHIVNQFRTLLNDVNTYPLEQDNSRLWRQYYNTRLAQLEGRPADAENVYEFIGNNKLAEPLLRAYALSDLGILLSKYERLSMPGIPEKALYVLDQSQRIAPFIDTKLADIFWNIRVIYNFKGEPEKGLEYLEQQLQLFKKNNNKYGIIYTISSLRHLYGNLGNWSKATQLTSEGIKLLKEMQESEFLTFRLMGHAPWHLIWSGKYSEAERAMKTSIEFLNRVNDTEDIPYLLASLGLVSGLQEKYQEAEAAYTESINQYNQLGGTNAFGKGMTLGFWGSTMISCGRLSDAEKYLQQSLTFKQNANVTAGLPEVLNWLGELNEVKAMNGDNDAKPICLSAAENYYKQSLDLRKTKRRYFECGALTGLARTKYSQKEYKILNELVSEAIQLAEQFEYYDYLAYLKLIQGHAVWKSIIPEWGNGFVDAFGYYKEALIYGLRYNRFLLDKVLSGKSTSMPFPSIFLNASENDREKKQMLIALRDWWNEDINEFTEDLFFQAPKDIKLVEIERASRSREMGDDSSQLLVIEKIDAYLRE